MSFKRAPRRCFEPRARRCAVHRALAIDEILRMITMHLQGQSASLLALTTTCKTWSSVALEGLWTEVSPQQLARISLLRNARLASNLPDIYAESLRKAQVLINRTSPQERVDIWSELPTFRPHTIVCLDSAQPIHTSVLAPHITTLIFAHDRSIWDAVWLANFSRDLTNVSKLLEVLEIALVPRPASMKVLSHLGGLHALRKLKLQFTDDCAYTWIQQPPLNEEPGGSSWPILEGKRLDALEELDIEAPIPIVQTFLKVTGNKLRNLRITGAPFDSATSISGLVTQISEGPWATGITRLRYDVSNRWPIFGDWDDSLNEWGIAHLKRETVIITSQTLLPLLRLSSLSHLALTFHVRPRIEGAFFGRLASKLQLLQNLSISGREREDVTCPSATLAALPILAQLPLLSALHITIDLRVDPAINVAVEQSFNCLTRLCVSGSAAPIDCIAIAPVLAALFPVLRKVYIPDSIYNEPHHGGWGSLWDTWQSRQAALGNQNTRPLEIEPISGHDRPNEQSVDEDFFVAALVDSIGIDGTENDSMDYLTSSVVLDEYYTRFPEARRHPFVVDDILYASPQGIST